MNLEIRSDGLHVSGYVNVTEKMSRPITIAGGKTVVEVIEPRAFEKALEKAANVVMTKDHNSSCVLAETRAGSLELYEDAIGLHAEAVITDPATVTEARSGKIKGWSFGMMNIVDKYEDRAGAVPLRRISGLDLDHITLVVKTSPAYPATSIEVRTKNELKRIEVRTNMTAPQVGGTKPNFDNSEYHKRIEALNK